MGAQWKAKHKDIADNAKGKLFGERRFSDATNDLNDVPFDTPPPTGKRISWREIAQ